MKEKGDGGAKGTEEEPWSEENWKISPTEFQYTSSVA